MAQPRHHRWMIAGLLLLAACSSPRPERVWRCYAVDMTTGRALDHYCECDAERIRCWERSP